MKQKLLALVLGLLFLLPGCTTHRETAGRTVVATTYPIYLFACAVTEGVEDVAVRRLNTGETSCLHDYTLSVNDMKVLAAADVIAMNGLELEEFLEPALASSQADVIDCSRGIEPLENRRHDHDEEDEDGHEGHDHGHFDPHIWMDPENARRMVLTLGEELARLDPANEALYRDNARRAAEELDKLDGELKAALTEVRESGWEMPGLITFHDGFQYFAHAFDLPLLESIEEEAGSEASAREIVEITELVKEYGIPVIFTEVSGSDATAKAIRRETGCQVAELTMIMDGADSGLSAYLEAQRANINAVICGFGEQEVVR